MLPHREDGYQPHPTDTVLTWARSLPQEGGVLIGADDLRAYVSLARALGLDAESYYLECRLRGPPQVDLLFAFSRLSGGLAQLPTRVERWCSRADGAARHAWRTAHSFVKQWATPGDTIHDRVSAIWFEFDDVRRQSEPAPSLSACIVEQYGRDYRPSHRSARPDTASTLAHVYRSLLGQSCDAAMVERIIAVTNALPEGGEIIHLSAMTARVPCSIKLYGVVRRPELEPFLRNVGWRGPFEILNTALAKLASVDACGDEVYFDLNLSNMSDPRACTLGIAFSQQQAMHSLSRDVTRRDLLELLASQRQCTSKKGEILAQWPTTSARGLGGSRSRVSRWLDIKTVLHGRENLQSKAYLGFHVSKSPFIIGD